MTRDNHVAMPDNVLKNMTQYKLEKAFLKMELNSCYGFPPIPNITMIHDVNEDTKITNEKSL